jgi:hypothetical protein
MNRKCIWLKINEYKEKYIHLHDSDNSRKIAGAYNLNVALQLNTRGAALEEKKRSAEV